MTYLLDTCIVSKIRKKGSPEALRLREWLAKHDNHSFFISVLTVGELQFGIDKLQENEKIKSMLQNWLICDLVPSFENRIISIDQHICSIWGKISASAAKKGITLPMGDALIAATALKHDLIVVTQNIRHFKGTEARIFDPLDH